MPQIIIKGTRGPVLQSIRRRWDPSRGVVVTEEYASAGDNLGGLRVAAESDFRDTEITPHPVRSRLLISSSGAAAGYGNDVTDTWQLIANQISRDVKEHPSVIQMEIDNPGSLAATIKAVQDAKENGEEIAIDPPFDDLATANDLSILMLHGITSYVVDQHVVRHTLNVPFRYGGSVEISSGIPGAMLDQLNSIAVNGPNDGTLFKWGWRRTGYQYTVGANNRVELNIEWALASWALMLYQGSITDLPA